MRTKFERQTLSQNITIASSGTDGVKLTQITLPDLEAGDAVRLRRVFLTVNPSSAAPQAESGA